MPPLFVAATGVAAKAGIQALGETVSSCGVLDGKRLTYRVADMAVAEGDRGWRGVAFRQAIHSAGDVDSLAADTEGGKAAGAGTIRGQGDGRGAALGARTAGIHADAETAVVSRTRAQQGKTAGS